MGIIRAAVNAVHGSLADQWLETVEPYEMGEHTVFTEGILVRKGQNRKGSQTISNGSVIHVYDNQFMMLVDGGKIVDYTAEPGYFTVDQSSSPSLFSGSLDAAVKDTFERLKFGGQTPHEQRGVLYQSAGNQGNQIRNEKSGQLFRPVLQCRTVPAGAWFLFHPHRRSAPLLRRGRAEKCIPRGD